MFKKYILDLITYNNKLKTIFLFKNKLNFTLAVHSIGVYRHNEWDKYRNNIVFRERDSV